jgi:hypothetical protein
MDTKESLSSNPPTDTLTETDSPKKEPTSPKSSFGSDAFYFILFILLIVGAGGGAYIWTLSQPEPLPMPQARVPLNHNSPQPAGTPASTAQPTPGTTTSSN